MTDKELDALIGEFAARFTLIQRKYLRRVGERLKRIGGLSAKDIHILSELRRMGTEMDEIQKEISRACGVSKEQLRSALDLAAKADTRAAEMKLKGTEEAEESDEGASPDRLRNLQLTPGLKSAVEAQAKVTAGEFDNLSQTTVQDDFYRHVIDAAAGAVTSGVDDYASAIRGAVKTLAANGLRVVYESGYTRRLDSAVRQNVLDAARVVSQAATDEVGRQLGADGVQISAHILCAPDHLPYQGRMYSNEEFEAIQDSLDRPFGMWNCRHIWYPAILGVTKQTYSEDTLKRYADLSNGKVKIGDRELTRYEWTQEQRKIETKLRDLRAEEAVWLAAGQTEELNRVRAEIRKLTDVYNLITREASLPARMERTEAVMPADLTNGAESTSGEGPKAPSYGVPAVNVTNEYMAEAKPGVGHVTPEPGYKLKKHGVEKQIAEQLVKVFGGDITLRKESGRKGDYTSDYVWHGKYWEQKTVESAKAADAATRHGLKQIWGNPGGLVITKKKGHVIDTKELLSEIVKRVSQGTLRDFDVIITEEGQPMMVYRLGDHKK